MMHDLDLINIDAPRHIRQRYDWKEPKPETEAQAERRRQKQAEASARYFAKESPEKRARRLAKMREYYQQRKKHK